MRRVIANTGPYIADSLAPSDPRLAGDPDHRAIVARRDWLVALAVTAMAGAAACGGKIDGTGASQTPPAPADDASGSTSDQPDASESTQDSTAAEDIGSESPADATAAGDAVTPADALAAADALRDAGIDRYSGSNCGPCGGNCGPGCT